MSKLSQMPFDQIGRDLDSTLHGASVIANNPDLAKTIASLQGVATSAKALVDKIDAGAGPALRELPAIAKSLETAVNQAARTMASVNQGYGDDSKFRGDLDKAILQLTDAVRSVRVLADLLARDPEALVRGRSVTGKE
jgi:paraquat-inducible protein B